MTTGQKWHETAKLNGKTLGKALAESMHVTTPGGFRPRMNWRPMLEAFIWACAAGTVTGLVALWVG